MGKVGEGVEKETEVAACLTFSGHQRTKSSPSSPQGKQPADVTQEMLRHQWSDVTMTRFRLGKWKGHLHTQKALCRHIFLSWVICSSLNVFNIRTDASEEKTNKQASLIFLFPFLHIWEMALKTCALLNAGMQDSQKLGSMNACLIFMALTPLCQQPVQ